MQGEGTTGEEVVGRGRQGKGVVWAREEKRHGEGGQETWERGRHGCGEWGRLGPGDAADERRGTGVGEGGDRDVKGDTERCRSPRAW